MLAMAAGAVLSTLAGCRLMDKGTELMQKLEKISIFIKKFFRKLLCYIYVFLLLYLTIIFILNYELYFIHIFNDTVSQPMPPSLFDYVQNQ